MPGAAKRALVGPKRPKRLSELHREHISIGLKNAYAIGNKVAPPGRPAATLQSAPISLVYIYGAFLGDGTAYQNTRAKKASFWYLRFFTGHSAEFAERVIFHLRQLGLRPRVYKHPGSGRSDLVVHVYSKALYDLVTCPLGQIKQAVRNNFIVFLKGFFDAEGNKTTPYFCIENTQQELMEWIHEEMVALSYEPTWSKRLREAPRKPIWRLYLKRTDAADIWERMEEELNGTRSMGNP